ncbi:MAG: zinc-dependent metalloprotease, partial [Bacteroidota bacterium]
MHIFNRTRIFAFTAITLFCSHAAFAKKKPAEQPKSVEKKSNTFQDKVKSCKKLPGLFTLYRDTANGSVYMVITKQQLNQTYIYFSYTENGVVGAGHFRGSFRDNMVFTIQRYYDRIEFVKQNTGFYFDTANAISKAANANISNSIVVSQKIVGEEGDNMLLDGNAIFLSENMSQIKPTPFPSPMGSMSLLGMLSKEKTKFVKLRNYENNTDVLVDYVYDNAAPMLSGGRDVTDPRSITITYQHTFIKAPETVMTARKDDQRVGFFWQQVNDMTTTEAVAYKDVIHRWRLEKKDKNAALSEPVKPITWWIENTTPREFRSIRQAAGLQWNLAFEKAGFKNAVVVLEQPDTATWDAGDIGYNVLRWTSSPNPPFGGYGPSFVDPRSGEILGADIMLEYIFVTNRINQEKLFEAVPSSYKKQSSELAASEPTPMQACEAGHHVHMSSLFGGQILEMRGLSELEKRDYMKQSLYYLILHEMGHTLGLMHNMRASQMWNPQQAHDKMLTAQYGLTASVMDYPAVNVALDKTKQGDYFTTRPGPYDEWAIEYGYSEALADTEKENERLENILKRSSDPKLIFGNDADDMRSPGKGIDPRVNINDFSSDVISYSVDRIKLINRMLPELPNRYLKPGKSNQEFKQAYGISMTEMMNATQAISRYIGGVYVDRNMEGKQAYTPVPLADQKRAMQALSQHLYSPSSMKAAEGLYKNLQSQRRGFNFFSGGEDPRIHDRVLTIQLMVMDHLLASSTLKRMTDSRLYGNQYSVMDMMTDLTAACFREDLAGAVNTFRQNLQVQYVKELCEIVKPKTPFSSYDNVARSAAIGQLKSVRTMMATPAASPEVKAHRDHLLLLIDEVFAKK